MLRGLAPVPLCVSALLCPVHFAAAGGDLSAPVVLDITRYANVPGRNRVEIRRAAAVDEAAAQIVTGYCVPWGD